jgi:hypothetical protein
MARSLIQRRQEAERARVEVYEASLRRVSQRARPAPDFHKAIAEARSGFEAAVVRDPWAWRPQMKTRDAARLRLAAARYLFARYPVGKHLEQIWVDHVGLERDEIVLRKRWYIVAAGGGSLYKERAGAWLSRKEVHAFLNPLGSPGFEAAIWQAIARSYADNAAIALRIARTRIVRTPRAELGFWREVVRFFCAHPATVEEMDDLRDYLADCRQREPGFSLKGRTLASLNRQMRCWHRDLEAIARIEAARRRAWWLWPRTAASLGSPPTRAKRVAASTTARAATRCGASMTRRPIWQRRPRTCGCRSCWAPGPARGRATAGGSRGRPTTATGCACGSARRKPTCRSRSSARSRKCSTRPARPRRAR